jgi:hypothetical protein
MSKLGNKRVVSNMTGYAPRTVDKYRNDPDSDFPIPVNIGNRPYWISTRSRSGFDRVRESRKRPSTSP